MNYSLRRTTGVGFSQTRQYLKSDEKFNDNVLDLQAESESFT